MIPLIPIAIGIGVLTLIAVFFDTTKTFGTTKDDEGNTDAPINSRPLELRKIDAGEIDREGVDASGGGGSGVQPDA